MLVTPGRIHLLRTQVPKVQTLSHLIPRWPREGASLSSFHKAIQGQATTLLLSRPRAQPDTWFLSMDSEDPPLFRRPLLSNWNLPTLEMRHMWAP